MNENEFDRTARAWLEGGPTRMSDGAVLSTLEEIHTTRQRRARWPARRATPTSIFGLGGPTLQRLSMGVPAGFAAIALFAVAAVLVSNVSRGNEGPAAASPTSPPSGAPTSGGMWPQSTLEEVRAAQERADAGDPAYTWQLDPQLLVDGERRLMEPSQIDIVDRFFREVLGWEAYALNPFQGMARNGVYDHLYDQRYLRCAPGETNLAYPGEGCAPTLDGRAFESVSIDLAQPVREDNDGIWVVNRWRLIEPFVQADPVAVEAQATKRLEEFLAARIARTGAEGLVKVDGEADVPLLYATSTGARYERFEIERVEGPEWPYGLMKFSARLFADGGATVVEEEIGLRQSGDLWLNVNATTENGQPVAVSYTSPDGEVSVSAPSTWSMWLPGKGAGEGGHEQALDVWFGGLWRPEEFFGSGERIGLVDPVAYDAWCAEHGGAPLLSGPANAAGIAQQVIADPDFETTAPVTATIGGLEAVSIDVALAPGGEDCGIGMIEIARWIHELTPGWRLRLYLVDLPEGMSVETLAITVVAPEDRFKEFIEETAPIIESIEFHAANAPSASP